MGSLFSGQVKIELVCDSGEQVCAEMPQHRFRSLDLREGSDVFLTPREIKVFVDDRSI